MPFASALSQHPVASEAVGEVAGDVLESLGDRPDLVVVTVSPHHAGALEDIGATIDAALHPRATIGAAATAVVGTGIEVEDRPAIGLWAARLGPVLELALDARRRADDGWRFVGWPVSAEFEPRALLLVTDPFTFPTAEFLDAVAATHPGLPVLGGQASAGRGPGGSRLLAGRRVTAAGATGALIGDGIDVEALVAQGCRPYGHPLTVTRAEGNVLYTLAGKPALDCLIEQSRRELTAEQISGIGTNGLSLGRLIDERLDQPGPGDFLVRTVVGVDRAVGAIAVDDRVPLGATVRFCLRDASTAHGELVSLLDGRAAAAALAFVCTARGSHLFRASRRDAVTIERTLGPVPVSGLFAAGEIGPIGGRNFVVTNSLTLALLRERGG